MNLITVFTPTFNRAYALSDLYYSLLKQNNYNFEWLIIDDGSIDDTEQVVNQFLKDDIPFDIRYFKKENGGKHTAINEGAKLAKGFLFFIVDSDDQLTPNAVEKLFLWEKTIINKKEYAGVSGNKGDLNGVLLGTTFSGCFIDATNLERKQNNILGDKAEAYYTAVLRKYPFPVIEGEKFMTESIVWDRIAASGLKIRWVNEVIYLVEQREDGLIAQGNKRFANSPRGYALSVLQTMELIEHNTKEKLLAGFYFYENIKEKVSIKDAAKLLNRNRFIFSMFWIYQTIKIKIKGIIRR